MDAASSKNGFWARANWLLRASEMLGAGLALVCLSGYAMMATAHPHSHSASVLLWTGVSLSLVGCYLSGFGPPRTSPREAGFVFLVAVCAAPISDFANPAWAARLLGVLVMILYLGFGWMRGHWYFIASIGWLIAGLTTPRFIAPPGLQVPYAPLCFIGGIGTAIQGGWELAHSLRLRAAGAPQGQPLASRPPSGSAC